MDEHTLEVQAASELERAGFLVQRDLRIDTVGRRSVHVDLVGWAASEDGELVPDVVVETKRATHGGHLAEAARQVGYYLPLVGAARAYVFDGAWHAVGDDFETVVPAECPRPARDATAAHAPKQLIRTLVQKSMDAIRSSATVHEAWESVVEGLATGAQSPSAVVPQLAQLASLETNAITIAEVMLEVVESSSDRRGEAGCYYTPASLNAAMVRLLAPGSGWTILDPFCGTGGTLLAAYQHAKLNGLACEFVGRDINPSVAAKARQLLQIARVRAEVSVGDSFDAMPVEQVQGIVACPPMNLRLSDATNLSVGGATRDGDALAVDRILRSLCDGGRAVVLLAPRLLFAGGSTELFRRGLAQKARVVSVIELPPQLLVGTAIRCAILVLERSSPTETLVARLEDDWGTQLSDDGEFIGVYRRHLEKRA